MIFFSLDEEPEDVSHRHLQHLPQPLLCCYLPSSTLTYHVELEGRGGEESSDGARPLAYLPKAKKKKETRFVRLT
jgi:hypothetical protein